MEIVSRRSGRNVLDMPFHLREVVRHVAAATGQIGRLGDTVQDDLLAVIPAERTVNISR